MKVAIIGSRLFNNYEHMCNKINELIKEQNISIIDITEIISGGAMGADKLAEKFADDNNISKNIIKPNYKDPEMIKKYGKERWGNIAPLERNGEIVKLCDIVIAFPFSESNGTLDAIKKAKKINKTVYVFPVDDFIKK
ncbi:MAG: hypothetical protein Terrestrivirus2_50 [Terrestrivirus sp.]|uniref:YspA cpYpsA-related SLOG domain-containing protein n=1 Tax=Terrestrivirus sp. TaxID=2487775 RepID=A0A3G4ZL23_9VIRU|nr:MAG: hypothetical protein Terrestrivirus2_50 [Terrestrivirus sp.]